MEQTTNYKLNKPDYTDVADIADINANMDIVDTVIDKVEKNSISHANSTANPHKVTKTQVGLGNVNNTSDLNKPISNAVKNELDIINKNLCVRICRELMESVISRYIRHFCMNHYGVPDCLLYYFCIGNIRNMKVSSFLCTCLVMGQDACGSRGLERISLFFRGSDFRCQNFWQVVW